MISLPCEVARPTSRRTSAAAAVGTSLLLTLIAAGSARAVDMVAFQEMFHPFTVGAGPVVIAVGDLNGDGRPDLASANSGGGTVSVLLGNGDGTFAPKTDFASGSDPYSVAIGDLDGNGRPDLVTANWHVGTASVLLGNGDGTFAAAVDYPTGASPEDVAIADLSGDGRPDLAIANRASGTVSVLLGNGDGTFATATDYATGTNPRAVEIAELSGDGRPDLAVACESGGVSVLLGNGDGTFAPATTAGAGLAAYSLSIGDLDGNGSLDLALALGPTPPSSPIVAVLLGNGDGTFGPPSFYGAGPVANSIAIADLNADGRPDLAAGRFGGPAVMLGNGDGTFGTQTFYPIRLGQIYSVAAADMNLDGKPDIAVIIHPSTIGALLLGNGDGTLGQHRNVAAGSPQSVAIADVNGDVLPDLVSIGGDLTVLLGEGDGTFGAPSSLAATGNDVAIGDLNGDGRPDLAIAGLTGGSILLGNGDGTFGSATAFDLGFRALAVAMGDLNDDGRPDLAVAGAGGVFPSAGPRVAVLLGNGDGSFGPPSDVFSTAEGEAGAIVVADVNGDGRQDLAVLVSGYVLILLGNGDGAFGSDFFVGVPYGGATPLAVGDLNGDGRLDLVAGGGEVSVLLGNGDGTFAPATPLPDGLPWVAIGDVDGDGTLDVTTTGDGIVTVHIGNGDGTFEAARHYGTEDGVDLALGDLNGDNLPDVVTVTPPDHLTILLNESHGPTTTLLSRFEAAWVGSGVEVRWQFGGGSDVVATTIERSTSATGPWAEAYGSRWQDGPVDVLTDDAVEPGHAYHYRLVATLVDGQILTFGPVSTSGATPVAQFALTAIAPVPTSGPARIVFATPREARVRLAVHDLQGRTVAVLVDGTVPAGRHDAIWNGLGASAGLYFVHFQWPGGAATRRLALTR